MILTLLCLLSSAPAAESLDHPEHYFASQQLPQEPGLYYRWDPSRSWGQPILVDTIGEVAEELAWILPEADPLMIGDVSKRGGGRIYGHVTHNMGIDVDVGLYTGTGSQPLGGFVDVAPTMLDLEANWTVIRTLLNSDHVAFILLDQEHINALRTYLIEELRMDPSMVDPIFPIENAHLPWGQRGVVRHAPNHRSHLHVRITYPPDEPA